MTKESDNETAVTKFRAKLNSSESYFNAEPFPKNESDKDAHKKCSDIEGAKKYCPKRWAALELWMAESRKASVVVLYARSSKRSLLEMSRVLWELVLLSLENSRNV